MIRKTKLSKTHPRTAVDADAELGRRIRKHRTDRKMSQQELAAYLGVSFQQVQKYEIGTNRVNANRLAIIASALKMKPAELFASEDALPGVSSLIDVSSKDTLRMLRAYCSISDKATQRSLVTLIETIADAAAAGARK